MAIEDDWSALRLKVVWAWMVRAAAAAPRVRTDTIYNFNLGISLKI
jgi:hypothetical protein